MPHHCRVCVSVSVWVYVICAYMCVYVCICLSLLYLLPINLFTLLLLWWCFVFSVRFLFFVVVFLSLILFLPFPCKLPKMGCVFFYLFVPVVFRCFLFLFFKSFPLRSLSRLILLLLLLMFYLSISFYHNISL